MFEDLGAALGLVLFSAAVASIIGPVIVGNNNIDQSTYDYVKLYIGYFSNRFPVWEGIFTLNFF